MLPVAASMASVDAVKRLSPGRWSPIHGPPLPVPQKVRLVAGSYVPVTHTEPPPVFHWSPFGQVSLPGSPGAGMVYVRQHSLPVSTSNPATNPRFPYSPPDAPTITLPPAISGAREM